MYSSFDMPINYADTDQYIRAVRFNLIRPNGDIKISAFKSNHGGVSVTRCNVQYQQEALTYMKSHFDGRMAVFNRNVCGVNGVYEKHAPSPGHNQHHWELYGSEKETDLSLHQIVEIIKECNLF